MLYFTINKRNRARIGQLAQTKETVRQLKYDPAIDIVIMPSVPIMLDIANKVPRIDW